MTRLSDEEIEAIQLEFRCYSVEDDDLDRLCEQAKLSSLEEKMREMREQFFRELHDIAGLCGHCGKRECSHRNTHSILPDTVAQDDIFTAFERADIALNNGVPQGLERSPNTSSTGNGKMFVMGREGLNPSPAGTPPYEPHLNERGEKSQAPFFVHPDTATPMTGDKATKEVVVVSLAYRVRQLIVKHGGMRLAARAVGIDPGYLSRMMSGDKTAPSDATLKRLGLRKIVSYQYEIERTLQQNGKP